MSIPGYVVPGQIICPVFERVSSDASNDNQSTSSPSNYIVRKYVAGHGVSISHLANDIVALTANVLGKVIVEQIAGNTANGSSTFSILSGASTNSTTSQNRNSNTQSNSGGLGRPRKNTPGATYTFKVSIEDKLVSPNGFQALQNQNQTSAPVNVTSESTSVLPSVGSVVLARVTKLTLRQANVQIISVEHHTNEHNSSSPNSANNNPQTRSTGFTPLTQNKSSASVQSSQNVPVSAESGLGMYGPVRGIVPFSQLTTGGSGIASGNGSGSAAGSGSGALSSASGSGAGGSSGTSFGSGLVNATDVGEGFGGIVRSQDVRLTERDKVKIVESFKPGDIIRASVVSFIIC